MLALFITTQCTYHNEEEYFSANENLCDTTNMSFSNDMVPIFENNCYACHNSNDRTAGIVLETYDGVKAAVETGRLIGAIKHEKGYANMPRSAAKLDDCTISKVEAWINQGMQDN